MVSVALPEWSDSFSVGHDELEGQHKRLLELCRRAIECLKFEDGRYRLAEARTILAELVDYVRLHFRAEEQMMLEHAYPDYAAHKETHGLYEMRLESLLMEAEDGILNIGEFVHYLSDWWYDHILVMDKAYTQSLAEKPRHP